MSEREFELKFRNRLENYQSEPDEAAWNHIINELDGNKKKRGFIYMLPAAATISLLLTIPVLLKTVVNYEFPSTSVQTIASEEVLPEENNIKSLSFSDLISTEVKSVINTMKESAPGEPEYPSGKLVALSTINTMYSNNHSKPYSELQFPDKKGNTLPIIQSERKTNPEMQINISPVLNFYKYHTENNGMAASLNNTSLLSAKRAGLRASTGVSFPLNDKFSLVPAISYQYINFPVHHYISGISENIDQNNESYVDNVQQHLMGLQVKLKYLLHDHPFKSYVSAGADYQLPLNKKGTNLLNLDIGYEMSFALNEQISINFQPVLTYRFNQDDFNSDMQSYGVGINFGVNYQLVN